MASMPDLQAILDRLGLGQYFEALTAHGFYNWETVLDITEADFVSLGFKLGHRRILQREIATFRGIPSVEPLELNDPSSLSTSSLEGISLHSPAPPHREKRRYRRHPRPDPNAPKRPKTAYVNFADQLRTDPEIRSLSFVDIAKEVGRRWQTLSADKKRVWESHAARAMQEYEAQMDDYKRTESWRKYQSYLSDFKARQSQNAKLKRSSSSQIESFLRGDSSRASPASSDSPGSLLSSSSLGTDAELIHNALTLALSELVSLRSEILAPEVQPYDADHLPPEEWVRQAMHAFVERTGSLIYIWTHSEVDDILNRIYRPTMPIDSMTLAECFTVAAMGAIYDMENFSERVSRLLYASGTLQFNEQSARVDYLRTTRLLLSLSFYALLEKHMSARYLISAGLQIARCRGPPPAYPGHETWKKLFRSLIFMDSWLSFTLGYSTEVREEDIALACGPQSYDSQSIEETVHTQFCRLALIAAEISRRLASPELATGDKIANLAEKLEEWRRELPNNLRYSELMGQDASDLSKYQKRAGLQIHMMYLGARILLYRQPLVSEAETHLLPENRNLAFPVVDTSTYIKECAQAGQQMASILRTMRFDGTLCKRCWLLIYWAFSASIVLLFVATIRLVDGFLEDVEAYLTSAKSCLEILEPCREFEPIAKRYLEIVSPLYTSLRDIHHRCRGKARTSISMLLQAEPNTASPPVPINKEEVQPTLAILCGLITDPFGRLQGALGNMEGRRILNGDGSYSVFWWR